MVYNTEGRKHLEDLKKLNKGMTSVGSKDSDRFISDSQSDLDNLNNGMTSSGSKGSYRVVIDDGSNLEGSKVLNKKTVDQYIKTTLKII